MLDDQIAKLASGEQESSWWKVILMVNMAQSDPVGIRDDHPDPIYVDTRLWVAIASKEDRATFVIVMHGFEKSAPELSILVRQLRFVKDEHCFLTFYPALLSKIGAIVATFFYLQWPSVNPNNVHIVVLLDDMISK